MIRSYHRNIYVLVYLVAAAEAVTHTSRSQLWYLSYFLSESNLNTDWRAVSDSEFQLCLSGNRLLFAGL